jgi:hypothetical protein
MDNYTAEPRFTPGNILNDTEKCFKCQKTLRQKASETIDWKEAMVLIMRNGCCGGSFSVTVPPEEERLPISLVLKHPHLLNNNKLLDMCTCPRSKDLVEQSPERQRAIVIGKKKLYVIRFRYGIAAPESHGQSPNPLPYPFPRLPPPVVLQK